MKIVFMEKDNIVAVSKVKKSVKASDKELKMEYARFKRDHNNPEYSFIMYKDTYNKYGENSYIFEAYLTRNSIGVL